MVTCNFRFNARNCALTYSQANHFTKQELYNFLLNLSSGDTKVDQVVVAQENHQDGGQHYHAYVHFTGQPCIRNVQFFDFHELHPNIQPCRQVRQWLKYISKADEEPLANFEWREGQGKKYLALKAIREAIQEKKTLSESIDAALDVDPCLIGSIPSLTRYYHLKMAKGRVSLPNFDISSFSLTAADQGRMLAYKNNLSSHRSGDRTSMRSMWFVGASRIGKTSLARSFGMHFYMHQLWNVDKISDEATYGVIDDLSWDKLKPYYKSIFGCQSDVTYTDKYREKREYSAGIPVIACTNELPIFSEEEKNWLKLNVTFYEFTSSILPNHDSVPIKLINI